MLEDLRELARLTGGPDGARRVCWTDEWVRAREFLRSRLDELPVEVSVDPAGNLWAELMAGERRRLRDRRLAHGLGAGRRLARRRARAVRRRRGAAGAGRGGHPPVGLRLVDWADEEGARFGRSLFGSSCLRRHARRRRGARPARPRRRAARGRGGALRRGARPRARVGRAAARRARLPRAAHRAGPGAREPRRAGGDRARHLRRGAPRGGLPRRGGARGRNADGAAARQLHGGRPGRARDPRGRASPTRAGCAPWAGPRASRAS